MFKNRIDKKQAEELFKAEILPGLSKNDKPAKRLAWGMFINSLCRDGQITSKQYKTWTNPRFVE